MNDKPEYYREVSLQDCEYLDNLEATQSSIGGKCDGPQDASWAGYEAAGLVRQGLVPWSFLISCQRQTLSLRVAFLHSQRQLPSAGLA